MTAMEGNVFFGIPNCCRVRISGHPAPSYDQESLAMDTLNQVVWSLLGAAGEQAKPWGDLDEVIRQAKMFPNITGGLFDDFISPARLALYTPDKIRAIKKRLCKGAGRSLDLWVVLYELNLDGGEALRTYLDASDVVTFWSWFGDALGNCAENPAHIATLAPGKRLMAGCYLWDYGNKRALSKARMVRQFEIYLDSLLRGAIDGIIVCSNCIADIGIENVDWMRYWIREYGDGIVDDI